MFIGLFTTALCVFLSSSLVASKDIKIDGCLYQQILDYDPQNKELYYSWEVPIEEMLEFVDVYERRPIRDNEGGIGAQGMFFLWYLLRQINPSLVIESGVWRGGSSWMIDQAAPNAQYIAIDPDLNHRVYRSSRATYLNTDFAELSIDLPMDGPVLVFFDDHQDAFQRVLQAHQKGIKHLIFDDNYPPNSGDGKPHLTLAVCLSSPEHKEKGDFLKKHVKHYYILPQIVGKTATNLAWIKNKFVNIPAVWENLDKVPANFRQKLEVFSNDSIWYRWMTYVELY